MLMHRKSSERGLAEHGWLRSRHTFSFASYYDPRFMGVSDLRVINEDRIVGGSGFGEHPHRDMEIISYVISGALKHRDSMGNETIIRPGEVQVMSAGTGVAHSEMNFYENKETHFFQIWILPDRPGHAPNYGQKSFEAELQTHKQVHVISPDGSNGSIKINQDANLYILNLVSGDDFSFSASKSRSYWMQVTKGQLTLNGLKLHSGDGVFATDESSLIMKVEKETELLLFDLRGPR